MKESRILSIKNTHHCIRLLCKFQVWVVVSLLVGCSSQPAQKDDSTAKPDMSIQVGSLNLSNHNKRIERTELRKLSGILKKEQIEVLAVQGITRYPGVDTRADFVNELAKMADLNSAFGEMVNNSGRQMGNAVFSSYPIRSKFNQSFEKVKSAKFEAALQAVIDGGTREVHVVAAQLPKSSLEDQISCIAAVSSSIKSEKSQAVILTGNLPTSERALGGSGFEDSHARSAANPENRIWYVSNEALKLISTRSVETEFGPMIVAKFGLFRQQLP